MADYSTFARRAAGLAGALAARGVTPGARVALFMANRPDYLVALYGIWLAGAAAVPINAKLHPREAAFILGDAGARLAFLSPELAAGLVLPEGCEGLVLGPDFEAMAAAPPLEIVARGPRGAGLALLHLGHHGHPQGGHDHPRDAPFHGPLLRHRRGPGERRGCGPLCRAAEPRGGALQPDARAGRGAPCLPRLGRLRGGRGAGSGGAFWAGPPLCRPDHGAAADGPGPGGGAHRGGPAHPRLCRGAHVQRRHHCRRGSLRGRASCRSTARASAPWGSPP